ncbi:MAG: ATP-binding protein [Oscillospiraceae bacterium]
MTFKIFRNAFLIGICVLLACSALFFGVMFSNYESQAFDKLAIEADYIAHAVERIGPSYLDTLSGDDRVTLIDADGTVLFDNAADIDTLSNHLDREEIAEAREDGVGQSSRYSQTLLERNHYYAVRLSNGSVLRVACTQTSMAAMLLMLLTPFLWVTLLILVLCGVIAFRLAKQITKPINAIDLDHPEIDGAYSELQPLVDRLRQQNRTIHEQMDELRLRQQEFSAITENMREGFLLVDGKTSILSSNHSAMQLLQLDGGGAGANLYQSCRRDEILRVVDTALSGNHDELLLCLDESTWQVVANPVISSGQVVGAVIIFIDVTEREQREALRREFSANVSHELKTPLTSISGFAELMKEGLVPVEKMREFSGDIYRESRRLIDLIDDIIKLSRLDEDSSLFTREMVDLYPLAEQVLEQLRAAASRQTVTLSLTGRHAEIEGVPHLLSEMIYNLCDNAIKYNVPGGKVTVSIEKSGTQTVLRVSDTGIGIPYAHQNRVFERFYRVDKSHSKDVGGTGLGLSIVKHAAQYHGARVELKSEPGKGSTFSVIF